MKVKCVWMFLICVTFALFSNEIVPGDRYTQPQFEAMNNLQLFARVPLGKKILSIYGTLGDEYGQFHEHKLAVLTAIEGTFFDAVGIRLYDNMLTFPTIVTETACCVHLWNEKEKTHQFLYVNYDSVIMSFYPVKDKYIADTCLTEKYIYYSTEMGFTTIRRISLETGALYNYLGYFPGVDLFEVSRNGKFLIWFTYENKYFYLDEDNVVLTTDMYSPQPKKQLRDYLVSEKQYN